MPKEIRNNKVLSATFLRILVNFWTLVFYAVIIFDFFNNNGLVEFLGPIAAIYIAILTVFSAEKEFERWHNYHMGRHPGEVYVFLWTALIVALIIPEFIFHTGYRIPSEVFSTYVVVIGILAITKKSKNDYGRNGKK